MKIEKTKSKNDNYGRYTVVHYDLLKKYGINVVEYCYLDYIANTSKRTAEDCGWSRAKPETIAEALGFTFQYIYKVRAALVEKGLLETKDRLSRVTVEWKKVGGGKGFTKFDNQERRDFKLTFLEYAFLKLGWELQKKSEYSMTSIEQKIVVYKTREIAKRLDTSERSIYSLMERLKKRGFIEYGKARTGEKYFYLIINMDNTYVHTVSNDADTSGYLTTVFN